MKTKIVSAVYFDLYGTDLGGRPGRNDHYLYSLNSIMGTNTAQFIIYTNDKNKVDEFFTQYYPDKLSRYSSIEYDLYNTEYKDKINQKKNLLETRKSDRCIELQYCKLSWLKMNISSDVEYIYWIDAGLCYSGLLPNKYLKIGPNYNDSYYGSDIFTSKFIDNLNAEAGDKIIVCAKDNVDYYWDCGVPEQYFKSFNSSYHIIGGLFGGNNQTVNNLCSLFYLLANNLLDKEDRIYSEEQILSCLFFNYPELFQPQTFDIWWHEDNISGNLGKEEGFRLLQKAKSFYKILEKFIL